MDDPSNRLPARHRWLDLLADLERLGAAVAPVEAAYRAAGGATLAAALRVILSRLDGELQPFVRRTLDDGG
jgi:hypothetical protein